jgi:hypothetical protein
LKDNFITEAREGTEKFARDWVSIAFNTESQVNLPRYLIFELL